jgi:hypothetical protein
MRAAIQVPNFGHINITVAKIQKRLRTVSGESSELAEYSKLDAVPAVCEPFFGHSQIALEVFCEILNIYCCFLPLLLCELVLLC